MSSQVMTSAEREKMIVVAMVSVMRIAGGQVGRRKRRENPKLRKIKAPYRAPRMAACL